MSWLDEAQQIVKQKQQQNDNVFAPNSAEQRERLVGKLKMLYDNATEREINKAIDDAMDRYSPPYDEKAFMDFLRVKLED